MARIIKNKSGTYTAEIYTGRNGNKKLMEYITCDGYKECKDAARKREDELSSNKTGRYGNVKFDSFSEEWFKANKNLLAPTTLKGYRTIIDAHLKDYFGNKKMGKITDLMIKKYMSEKLDAGLSPTTVRKHFFALSKILSDALKANNPCIGIKAPVNSTFKPQIPTEEEFNKIYETFKAINREDEAIILLAGECGLRRGEIFALKWDDLNEEKGFLRIDEAVALKEDGYDFEVKRPKSENGVREIVITDYMVELLQSLKANPAKLKRYKKHGVKLPDIDYFICRQDPHSFTKKYKEIMTGIGLPNIRFHDLRHYHASMLYKNHVPDQYVADRLGHDIWVLKKIYQHLGLEQKKDLDDKVKTLLK